MLHNFFSCAFCDHSSANCSWCCLISKNSDLRVTMAEIRKQEQDLLPQLDRSLDNVRLLFEVCRILLESWWLHLCPHKNFLLHVHIHSYGSHVHAGLIFFLCKYLNVLVSFFLALTFTDHNNSFFWLLLIENKFSYLGTAVARFQKIHLRLLLGYCFLCCYWAVLLNRACCIVLVEYGSAFFPQILRPIPIPVNFGIVRKKIRKIEENMYKRVVVQTCMF